MVKRLKRGMEVPIECTKVGKSKGSLYGNNEVACADKTVRWSAERQSRGRGSGGEGEGGVALEPSSRFGVGSRVIFAVFTRTSN
jgi:hypothetical protein